MKFSDEIVKKCAYDPEMRKIIYYIASLADNEKENFKKKVNMYFMNKNTDNDTEAYKFYKVLLADKNAELLMKKIENLINE